MLTEIVAGKRYLRRDGVAVVAATPGGSSAYSTELISMKPTSGSAGSLQDPFIRWRRTGEKHRDLPDNWENFGTAGQVPRNKGESIGVKYEDLDIISCLDDDVIEPKQLELF